MNDVFKLNSLVEIDGNPKPEGLRTGVLSTRDRIRLRFAVCPSTASRTRGTIVLLQGRNESIEKYFETITDLAALGYMVATFDWRGQGGSDRLLRDRTRGHVTSFDAYVSDLESMFRDVILPDCRGPYALLGHSMGGAVALMAAPRLVNRVERIVVGAPLVALAARSRRTGGLFYATSALGLLGLGSLPVRRGGHSAGWTAERNPLTHDARRFERNRALEAAAPHLFAGRPTAAWVAAATRTSRRFDESERIAEIKVPTLVVTAGADSVVSSPAAERLAWRMRSGHGLSIPGARHELMQEADVYRAPFLAAADAFIGGALTF
ncbi:MAG: alpha/beta hydrolase [Rhizobiaceae bacterium]|nr:alpha/beta hydrolase [Rhizobiaceae bacterium]